MTSDPMARVREWFDRHVAETGLSPLPHVLGEKVTHSGLVASMSRRFAVDLGWSDRDIRISEAIGQLHDVARFPQYRDHGTFSDARSVDHGDLGAKILAERFDWDLLPAGSREIVIAAVRAHNKRFVPDGLPAESMPFVLMIRDCDKLDVFRIVREHEAAGSMALIYPRLDPSGPPTPEVLAEVLATRTASYENVRTLADLYLLKIAWLHSMTYAPAYRHIVETGFLGWIAPRLPPAAGVKDLIEETIALVDERGSGHQGQ